MTIYLIKLHLRHISFIWITNLTWLMISFFLPSEWHVNCILLGYYAASSDMCPQIPCGGQNPNFSAPLKKYECFYGNTELHNLSLCWMHIKSWYK